MRTTWNRITPFLSALARRLHPFATGAACGTALLLSIWAFQSQWGASLPVTTGLLLAMLGMIAWGLNGGPRLWARRSDLPELSLVFVAVGTIAAPFLSAGTIGLLGSVPQQSLESPLVSMVLCTIAAWVTIGPVAFFSATSGFSGCDRQTTGSGPLACGLAGIAASLLLVPTSVLPFMDAQTVGWVSAAILCCLAAWGWQRTAGNADQSLPSPASQSDTTISTPAISPFDSGLSVLGAAIVGACIAATLQISNQLLANVAYIGFAQLGGMLCGATIAQVFWYRRPAASAAPAAVAWTALLTATFPWLVQLSLISSAYVSDVGLLTAIRSATAAVLVLPLGTAAVMLVRSSSSGEPRSIRHFHEAALVAIGVGFALHRLLPLSPATVLTGLGLAAAAIATLSLWRLPTVRTRTRLAFTAACAAVACLSGLWSDRFDTALPARILFSAESFAAYRDGTRIDLLPHLDEARLISVHPARDGIWTVWKRHGGQVQLRENGIPRYTTSVDLTVSPHASAELLPAVVPLVLHPQARHVLLTGIGGTATLSSCLAFPVQSVTCTETDPALLQIARDVLAPTDTSNTLDDPRLALSHVDSSLLLAAGGPTYDVIIDTDGQAALTGAASRFTTEHYTRIARRLAPGGIFCQRFQHYDFGPQPIRDLAATLQTAFPRVILIEASPGELLLLGLDSDAPFDTALTDRASAPHVRRVLSQAGWDWSVLLALPVVDVAAVEPPLVDAGARPNAAASGRFAFAMPQEMMRWAPKLDESHKLLTGYNARIVDWLGDDPAAIDVNHRLADVNEQYRVVSEHPDLFWAYRQSLKRRLQDRPRTAIIQVAHEGLKRKLHPEDQRRKDFLLALSAAATQEHPSPSAIAEVAQFVDPYDPLVSYFTHHEAAYLWSRAETPDPAAELAHRLHTVYFGPGYDCSVRNITAALELIVAHPAAMSGADDRWDHINALLETLRQRWEIRTHTGGARQFTAADAEESLNAAKRAIDCLDEIHAEVGIDGEAWNARRDAIERRLIRPLRTYRSTVGTANARRDVVDPETL